MAKFVIEINDFDNEEFQSRPLTTAKRIIMDALNNIRHGDKNGFHRKLLDINGNSVGEIYYLLDGQEL